MAPESTAFPLLHPTIQNWIADQRWAELRDIQERAIPLVLERKRDVILSASTAAGKTEAAFLPILTDLINEETNGLGALYLSPLKALINDQFRRIELLCESLEMPVHKWHGDVASSVKKRAFRSRRGVLLITPESLEALFVLRGSEIQALFGGLRFVVIDELHSFIGTERGRQVQSLLARIEQISRVRVPRVGLSATLGDANIAARFLRSVEPDHVTTLESREDGRELRVQIRGYEHGDPFLPARTGAGDERAPTTENLFSAGDLEIARDLFAKLRGGKHLVFANSRANVEFFSDALREKSETLGIPNEFFPHHGNLSKEIREDAEARLRDDPRPATVVCTSTLEMGIDIKQVESVAQIGAPFSVSSLRQRLGRSGRKTGDPAILRMFIKEEALTDSSSPTDMIRAELFQAVAMIELLLEKWCEPPKEGSLHLSTLVQQILSVVAQHGGIRAAALHSILCERGPFASVERDDFATLLRELGRRDILIQAGDGTLITGLTGERLVNHYSFYAAFSTPEEFRLVADDELLGTMPITGPIAPDAYLIFGGRRWQVVEVDASKKVILLKPAPGKNLPKFSSPPGLVHDRIRQKMFELYTRADIPKYLDERAAELFAEGRKSFVSLRLAKRSVIRQGEDVCVLLWKGDRILHTVAIELRSMGFAVESFGCAITVCRQSVSAVETALRSLQAKPDADPVALAESVGNKLVEKYDELLPENLLCKDFASRALSSVEARAALRELVFAEQQTETDAGESLPSDSDAGEVRGPGQ